MSFKAPKLPPPPPPPPAPKAIPTEQDVDVRTAQIESERNGRNRRGRQSTVLSGVLGDSDGSYGQAATTKKSLLG